MENREAWLEEELAKTRSERDEWKRRYWYQKTRMHRVASLLDDKQLLKVIEHDPEAVLREECKRLFDRVLATLPDDRPAESLCTRGGE